MRYYNPIRDTANRYIVFENEPRPEVFKKLQIEAIVNRVQKK